MKQLSSHNDSIEYTIMNFQKKEKKYVNMRQYFIKALFLTQRSKRVHVNCILSLFSYECSGLCTSNKLNLYVILIQLFLSLHAGLLLYLLYQQQFREQTNYKLQVYIFSLVVCLYPMLLTFIAVAIFIQSLACSQDYGNVHVWHRNSIIQFI